jgi:dTMP kinase
VSGGLFITLEGGEGAGKSTQQRRLATLVTGLGRRVLLTREPGGSPGAEAIRSLLLDPRHGDLDAETQALLFAAARRDHMRVAIRPALRRGKVVICDRFVDSTRAYQGAGGALSPALIRRLEWIAVGRKMPDLTLVLDIDPTLGLRRALVRAGSETADPFEARTLDFHHRVREAFLAIARAEPQRCVVIDAAREPEHVFEDIRRIVAARLARP